MFAGVALASGDADGFPPCAAVGVADAVVPAGVAVAVVFPDVVADGDAEPDAAGDAEPDAAGVADTVFTGLESSTTPHTLQVLCSVPSVVVVGAAAIVQSDAT